MDVLSVRVAPKDKGNYQGRLANKPSSDPETALQIDVAGDEIVLRGSVSCRLAAEYLGRQKPAEWGQLFGRALEVGVFCLERASGSQDMEFVRRQADRVMQDVATVVGAIPEAISARLTTLIGTKDGHVLAPIVQLVNSTASVAEKSVSDARRLLLDIDPARSDGTVGRALKSVRDLLDPQRKDSVQGRIEQILDSFGDRGGTFANVLRVLIEEALAPVRTELRSVSDRVVAQDAAQEVVSRTTEKGLPYELEVVERVHVWARAIGARVEHVGADNQPGDVVVCFGPKSIVGRELVLVIEARDRTEGKGLKRVNDDLEAAMRQRNGTCALYVGRTPAGFAKEIGEWADGRCQSGPFVACVDGLLEAALRYVVALVRLDDIQQAHRDVDAAAIQPYVAQIRTSVERTRSAKAKLTTIDAATGDIRRDLDTQRSEIVGALESIETILRKSAPKGA